MYRFLPTNFFDQLQFSLSQELTKATICYLYYKVKLSKICKKINAEDHTFVENYIEEFNYDPSNDISKSYASIDHEMLKRYPEVELAPSEYEVLALLLSVSHLL